MKKTLISLDLLNSSIEILCLFDILIWVVPQRRKVSSNLYNNLARYIQNYMEGHSYQFRPTSWKYSMIKHNTAQSRIITDNKDIPSKFSPARNVDLVATNTSKSLVRSKIMSRSHDEIALKDLKESSVSREKHLQKKQTIQSTVYVGNNLKQVQSEENLNSKIDSPLKRKQSRKSSAAFPNLDIIKDIKLEFLRFKQKVLNQLKRQQELIKKSIDQIMLIVSKSAKSSIITSRIKEQSLPRNIQIPQFDSPIDFTKNLPKISTPANTTVDVTKYRESLVTDKIEIESVMPKIKQRVSRMFNLMGQLKTQITEQSFHPSSIVERDITE